MSIFPLLAGGLTVGWDMVVEKKEPNQAFFDGILMSGSLLTTKVGEALFESKVIDQFGNGMTKQYYNYLASPIINAYVYDYLYGRFY